MSESASGVVVTAMGNGWVVQPAGGPAMPELAAAVERLPAEPGYVPVAVSPRLPLADDAVLMAVAHEVRRKVLRRLPQNTGVRLAVPNTGQGSETVAGRLGRLVRRSVVAPDGPVWVAVDQSLLVGPAAGSPAGRWRTFTVAGAVRDTGPRHPAPPWQPPGIPYARAGTVDIPAGWWLTSGEFSPDAPGELPFDLAPATGRCLLVIGGPSDEPVTAGRVVEHLRALPGPTRELCVLVGYDSRHPAGPLASQVAAMLDEPVRHGGGLPMLAEDGTEQWFVAHQGELVAAGFVDLAEALAAGGDHRVVTARPPLTGWRATDGPAWPLTDGWTLEVVLSGLWLRPDDVPPTRAGAVRALAAEAGVLSVIVEPGPSGAAELPANVLTHLLARLPAGQREQTRVVWHGIDGHR
ncbi:hypothetical protein KIF24_10375 [Micromonospora sp. Llam7]|uniref:hypothetical protein n=1 Tax=Micromonospora tarapacensis TaxID=2835305 RepID=UPI001C83439B|nr:hypothetical protein [Micromonospora tarapacensis]MBX7266390.1 hypothetical protein [Micromonospora tarapacensis]